MAVISEEKSIIDLVENNIILQVQKKELEDKTNNLESILDRNYGRFKKLSITISRMSKNELVERLDAKFWKNKAEIRQVYIEKLKSDIEELEKEVLFACGRKTDAILDCMIKHAKREQNWMAKNQNLMNQLEIFKIKLYRTRCFLIFIHLILICVIWKLFW
ncbi:unnamed protein product [Caenorhabditis nigoni]